MRRFFIENRRLITMVIVVGLGIILARYIMDYFADFDRRIITNNEKVVYNGKKVYIKNIKIEGITNKSDSAISYTTLNLDTDDENEMIVEIYGSNNAKYFVIDRLGNNYIMYNIDDDIEISNMKKGGVILLEDGSLIKLEFDINVGLVLQKKLAYKDEERYIVEEKSVTKREYDRYIKDNYTSLPIMTWK